MFPRGSISKKVKSVLGILIYDPVSSGKIIRGSHRIKPADRTRSPSHFFWEELVTLTFFLPLSDREHQYWSIKIRKILLLLIIPREDLGKGRENGKIHGVRGCNFTEGLDLGKSSLEEENRILALFCPPDCSH